MLGESKSADPWSDPQRFRHRRHRRRAAIRRWVLLGLTIGFVALVFVVVHMAQ